LFKRIVCLCLVCILSLGMCALAEESANASLVMAGLDLDTSRNWKGNDFFKRMEEKHGISFTFQQYTDAAQWKKAKADMLSGGELPDVLFKANFSQAETIEMLDKKILIDLAPYLKGEKAQENYPNLFKIFQEHPEYLDAITLPDGQIGALPQIQDYPAQNFMWINEKWLKNLNLKAPTTAQELVEVLTAFKTRDPNRNMKNDEIPLGFIGPYDLKFLGHAFGLIANDYNIYAHDGKAHFMPLDKEYRTFVTWLKDLYDARLLDQKGFAMVDTMRTVTDSEKEATYGMILTNAVSNIFQVTWSTDYNILAPLEYDGEQIYRNMNGNVMRGTFAITRECSDPEAMLKWADDLYSQEGAILAAVGKKDSDYVIDGDGTWRYLDHVKSNKYFTTYALIDGLPFYPGIQASEFLMNMSGLSDAQRAPLERQKEIQKTLKMPFPYYTLTREQENEIAQMQKDIAYYVDLQLGRWVLGEEEISDETFAAFEENLMKLGLPDFLAFWQNILDQN